MVLGISVCASLIAAVLAVLLYKAKKHHIIVVEQLNEQVAKYKEEAEEATKKMIKAEADLEARTALLKDVSHELRSKLHGVVSLSDTVSKHWLKIADDRKQSYVVNIFNTGIEVIKLLNDLLDFTKFDGSRMVFDFEEMSLVESLDRAVKYCSQTYFPEQDSRFNLINKITGEALVNGDKERIHQLLTNLFINAIKYSGEGKITAELKEINYNGKSYWEFTLSDEGVGIPEDELETIFEPFTQSTRHKPSKKMGSGLGLTLCKQIVEAHSGNIWAENNSGGPGAKFSFIFPILNTKSKKSVQDQEK